MKLGLLGYTSGSIFNRTAKIGIKRLEQTTLGLSANRTSISTITRKSGVYRPEDNSTKQYYKGNIQSFYSVATNNLTYVNYDGFTTSNPVNFKPSGLENRPDDSSVLYITSGAGDLDGTTSDDGEVYQLPIRSETLESDFFPTSISGLTWSKVINFNNTAHYPNLQSMRWKSDGSKLFGIGTLRTRPIVLIPISPISSTYYGSVMLIYPIASAFSLSSTFITDPEQSPEVYYFNGETSYTSAQVGSYGVDDPYDTSGLSPNGYRIKESFINPDGLIFYYLIGNIIHQGSLSTAWSLSSVTLNQSSLNVGDSTINAFTFNSDGKKLFTFGTTNNRIQQYNLGTAWQISTASLSSTLDLTVSGGDMRIGIRMLNSQSTIMCLSRMQINNQQISHTSDAFLHEIDQALY